MNYLNHSAHNRMLCSILLLIIASSMAACSNKEKKYGQALVRVNGEEITVLQVNDELMRSGAKADQETASKKMLEALIDRELIKAEATHNKLDRTPEVVQAIERAKAQVIAQAYLQNITAKIPRPAKAEVEDYFQKHPEFFTQRKLFEMSQLMVSARDFSDPLRAVIESAKSLDDVASWLDGQKIPFTRNAIARTTADLPPEMTSKLLVMPAGKLFIVNEGDNSLIVALNHIKNSPVSETAATPLIEQYLMNKKGKEAADAEIVRLRAMAKIEYLTASAPVAAQTQEQPVTDTASQVERGAAGLK
ncbi:MAG: EpsD family peptidyl-prolyl cis-trans isomerase [Gallionellaceae bacterium]|nr:EpsD family peptidyl-prolyl cis-trans isomerase [Gallionellaceae bacterium]